MAEEKKGMKKVGILVLAAALVVGGACAFKSCNKKDNPDNQNQNAETKVDPKANPETPTDSTATPEAPTPAPTDSTATPEAPAAPTPAPEAPTAPAEQPQG